LNIILLLVSGLTRFIAGLGANFEYDLKKIIAMSTLRQLGLMIIIISVGLSGLALFHLGSNSCVFYGFIIYMCWRCYSFYGGLSKIFVLWVVYLFIYLLLLQL